MVNQTYREGWGRNKEIWRCKRLFYLEKYAKLMFFSCFYLRKLSSKQGSNVSQEPLLLHPFIPQALSTGISFRLWNFFQQKSIRISWNRRRSANVGKMSELRYLNREPPKFFLPEIVFLASIEAREAPGDLLQVRI